MAGTRDDGHLVRTDEPPRAQEGLADVHVLAAAAHGRARGGGTPARTPSPSSTASSRRRIASAPSGSSAPVEMRIASPGRSVAPNGAPARLSPTRRSAPPAAASAARSA